MNEKRCPKCGETKIITEFGKNKSRYDGLQGWCRECMNEKNRSRYADNPVATYSNSFETRRERLRDIVWEHLSTHPCVDCGETDPIVLEFDHIRDKSFNISEKVSSSPTSVEKLLEEIAKCEVRCANCHRRVTYVRSNNWRIRRNKEAS